MKYTANVLVTQTSAKLSDIDDFLDNPAGMYRIDIDLAEVILDHFHSTIPIGCLDDFDITIDSLVGIGK